jgi:class 3 adenylate cyclase
VTFLLTDIEGSTRLWESVPEAMEVALERHNGLLAEMIGGHSGVVVTSRGEGDSFFAVFPSAVSAVEAAGACQLALNGEAWPAGAALRVRMGLHTGEARLRGSDHVDHAPINRCARVKAAAHGGQVLVTKTTRDLVEGRGWAAASGSSGSGSSGCATWPSPSSSTSSPMPTSRPTSRRSRPSMLAISRCGPHLSWDALRNCAR